MLREIVQNVSLLPRFRAVWVDRRWCKLAAMSVLRFSLAAFAASSLLAAAALGSCGINTEAIWICNNPATGKAPDDAIYDPKHYVDGVFDPCHCYDPCGELPQCPILVNDGGPAPGAVCADAGTDGP